MRRKEKQMREADRWGKTMKNVEIKEKGRGIESIHGTRNNERQCKIDRHGVRKKNKVKIRIVKYRNTFVCVRVVGWG